MDQTFVNFMQLFNLKYINMNLDMQNPMPSHNNMINSPPMISMQPNQGGYQILSNHNQQMQIPMVSIILIK